MPNSNYDDQQQQQMKIKMVQQKTFPPFEMITMARFIILYKLTLLL